MVLRKNTSNFKGIGGSAESDNGLSYTQTITQDTVIKEINMLVTAWGQEKELMDFLNDTRIHPSLTRDVVVKRIKRGEIPEIALTKGVSDENKVGDTKLRRAARDKKAEQRCKMFLLAQEVRRKHDNGVGIPELQRRYQMSRSQVEKIISKNEWFNYFWLGSNIPDEFKEIAKKIKEKEKRNE